MTDGDRRLEWLIMSLELSMPLIVGGALYFLDAVEVIPFGMIFTAGFVAMRVQARVSQRPSKIVVDPEGITRELFWTGRKEHLSFDEITLVKRHEYWGTMDVWYSIETATDMRWAFERNRGTEEFDQCFAFITEMWERLNGGGLDKIDSQDS